MKSFAKQGGEGWQPCAPSFKEAMLEIWGPWGVCSEFGRLRAVLMRRPGKEVEAVTDFNAALWLNAMDPELARSEHDRLADLYRENGVQVHYLQNAREDKPNSHFIRDTMLMTPQGAIIARPASQQRAGEERWVAETLCRLGVPLLMTVHGRGTFEGADAALAGTDLAFVAEGQRTNKEGADQVQWALHQVGFKRVVRLRLLPPYFTVHLDGVLSLLDRDLALVRPGRTPDRAIKALRDHGFRLLPVPSGDDASPLNGVALAPGKLILPAGNPQTKRLLQEAGCTVVEINIDEIRKSGGALHCMTGFLQRDNPRP